jgi:hypothetical protein
MKLSITAFLVRWSDVWKTDVRPATVAVTASGVVLISP